MNRTLVIIPALNESESIAAVIAELRTEAPFADLLVIDDGSTDDTAARARDAGADVVSLAFNMGVGTALRTGFRYAARYGYDRVVQTDADGQHDGRYIATLLAELDAGADMVIGSRFIAGDGHYEVEATRGLAMRVLRVMLGVLLGRRIVDSTSGFRAFSGPLVEYFAETYPREFLSDTVEALVIATYAGYDLREVPVQMRHRTTGTPSHRSLRLMYHYIRVLVVMGLTASFAGRRASRQAVAE